MTEVAGLLSGLPDWMEIIIALLLFMCSAVVHEQAHYKVLKHYYAEAKAPVWGKDPKRWLFPHLQVSWPTGVITMDQEKDVYFLGIVAGIIPVVIGLVLLDLVFGIILVVGYAWSCRHDIQALADRVSVDV